MPLDLAGLRAFVVEDEALVLMTLEDMLADLGCQVVAAARHLDDALRLARETAADVRCSTSTSPAGASTRWPS